MVFIAIFVVVAPSGKGLLWRLVKLLEWDGTGDYRQS